MFKRVLFNPLRQFVRKKSYANRSHASNDRGQQIKRGRIINIMMEKAQARQLRKIKTKEKQDNFAKYDNISYTASKYGYIKPRIKALNNNLYATVIGITKEGEFEDIVDKYGVEVTGVMVSPDYKNCSVNWVSSCIHVDEYHRVNMMLQKKTNVLRKEVIASNIMGKVPFFNFVVDKSHLVMRQLETQFNTIKVQNPVEMSSFEEMNFDSQITEAQQLEETKTDMFNLQRDTMMRELIKNGETDSGARFLELFDVDVAKDKMPPSMQHLHQPAVPKERQFAEDHERAEAIPILIKDQSSEEKAWNKKIPKTPFEDVPMRDEHIEPVVEVDQPETEFYPEDTAAVHDEVSKEKSVFKTKE